MRAGLALLACAALISGCGESTKSSRSITPARATTTAPAAAPKQRHQFRTVARLTLPANLAPRNVPVAILTYHRVSKYAEQPVKSIPDETVEPETFFAHLKALKEAGFHTITQEQLFNALVGGGRKLPSKPVMISVDDGYKDDYVRILPALQYFDMVGTFYVITRRLGEPGFLTERQVRKLDDAGMDIGAHTRHHVSMVGLDPGTLRSEIAGSRKDLERILHHPVYWFAYPFGAHDAAAEQEVGHAGFMLATTTEGGIPATSALMTLPRVHVGRLATPAEVVAMAQAG